MKIFKKKLIRGAFELMNFTSLLIAFFTFLIFFGFYGFWMSFETNVVEFYWQVILFSFVAGTFILTIKPEGIEKENRILLKSGFLMIMSGIIVLFGMGFVGINVVQGHVSVLTRIGAYVCLVGLLTLSAGVSTLFVMLFRKIISLKKK